MLQAGTCNICSVDWPAFFSATKDIALAAAAVVTATVAVRGLRKWSEELRGKADFDVARGLARATFKLREEINSCRSQLTRILLEPKDMLEGMHNQGTRSFAEQLAFRRMYKERWDRVASALQEFDTQALEAEALWGSEIRTDTQTLRGCANTLYVAIEAILDDKAADGDHFKADPELGKRMRANAHGSPTDTGNELSNQIAAAVSRLEAKLRKHLARPR